MRKIAVIGTGYVGLVTGACFAEIGHQVKCLDIDEKKIYDLSKGIIPFYEPGLEDLVKENLENNRLFFTTNSSFAFHDAEVIYIAVGTPAKEDGSSNLEYIFRAANNIAKYATKNVIVVTKSTVPVGTNERIKELITMNGLKVEVVSNPEFLREGQAINDTFRGDRIIIGSDNDTAATVIEEINQHFHVKVIHTDIKSAEMIKYASNAFLATKISFINEISTICEKLGANIEDVAYGMGLDSRIGTQFLKAGIGYGGSCFPKDTKSLVQIAGNVKHKFDLLEAVINVNNKQQVKLVEQAMARFGNLQGLNVALLGLSFKPNTDDVRESASIVMTNRLLEEGVSITAYDPVAIEKAKSVLPSEVHFTKDIVEALYLADMAFIITDWDEIKRLPLSVYENMMRTPVIYDGRNCYSIEAVKQHRVEYHSIGRKSVKNLKNEVVIH
ncbi:UDP-glucose dehydrogenase family protein [Robertmurraya kyonggiensis]|uniref:UDP-glucose 6-dehydrogenase n=1 Tax=Robertmurraya kyonggiensis TaxID=1037680 RepID=A0A4U1DAX7_9BACI|nr:UDP-glucose/GDP-mannose dehydrogenase family protein [Robertmurraya kyonggiensis]TKC19193.1 UDP-glucose/GDP-mannose dehydrogenase family protein [Robertmurraya kyonggiensis]